MTLLRKLFPGRYGLVGLALAVYLAVNGLVRLGLLLFNGDTALWAPSYLLPILGIGTLFDLAAGTWWLLPFAFLACFWPNGPRSPRSFLLASTLLLGAACLSWVFIGVAEFVFWNEFSSRFNFIAVDYLVYTREVIGNIRESYNLTPLFIAVGLSAGTLLLMARRTLKRVSQPDKQGIGRRLLQLSGFLLLPAIAFVSIDARLKEFTHHAQATQLAGNGHFEFWHAFRHNEIDYARFYLTLPEAQAQEILRQEFAPQIPAKPATPADASEVKVKVEGATLPIEREIVASGSEKKLNVVLISVESLSAEFLNSFGSTQNITPNLDALAAQGLLFTRMYATGTRTVRGLEALTLSIPPTPGNSIVKRPNNGGLRTLGGIFAEHGYEPLYLYGGYGYFDNMNAFFGGNGYTVIDRTAIAPEAIHYENIWGVADEDLFTLALAQLDARQSAGKPFFAHIMTTSNHRPVTYPAGRIDIPSGTGRAGAVKYTDWAIGDFIARAKTKPWFAQTVFVIVADHTASGRGKTDLPIEQFLIPLIIYAPGQIAPGRIDTLASQIDVAPTLLGLLNFSYRSRFFGQDILATETYRPRAFLANYQTVGYLADNTLVELRPQQSWRLLDATSGEEMPITPAGEARRNLAVSYYQTAAEAFRTGALREVR